MSDDNVRSYRRKKLEPEVAAVSFQDSDETPVIVINVDERRTTALAALKKLRPHVLIPLIPGLVVAAAERLVRKMREHSKATVVIGATATAASAIAISPISIKWDTGDQLDKPPAAIRVVTQPAVTHTLTAPAAPTLSPPAPRRTVAPERSTPLGTGRPQPAASDPSSPAARPSRPPSASSRPSSRPSTRTTSRPSTRPTSRPSTSPRGEQEDQPRPTSPPATSPQPQPSPRQEAPPPTQPTQEPTQAPTSAPSTAPPETSAGSGNCAIRVDLDPLLDLCVLG